MCGVAVDRVLRRIPQLVVDCDVSVIRTWLDRVERMPRGQRILRRMARDPDEEQVLDLMAEVLYALVFAGLGFEAEIEPFGGKGPDLRVSRDGHSAVVEVTRFRRVYPGPPTVDFTSAGQDLATYGDPLRDTRKATQKILGKFRQVQGESAIIAIWNDDEDLEDTAVATAVNDIRRDAARGALTSPSGLLFVVYGSKWVRARDRKQFYCFPFDDAGASHRAAWQRALDKATVRELIERALSS